MINNRPATPPPSTITTTSSSSSSSSSTSSTTSTIALSSIRGPKDPVLAMLLSIRFEEVRRVFGYFLNLTEMEMERRRQPCTEEMESKRIHIVMNKEEKRMHCKQLELHRFIYEIILKAKKAKSVLMEENVISAIINEFAKVYNTELRDPYDVICNYYEASPRRALFLSDEPSCFPNPGYLAKHLTRKCSSIQSMYQYQEYARRVANHFGNLGDTTAPSRYFTIVYGKDVVLFLQLMVHFYRGRQKHAVFNVQDMLWKIASFLTLDHNVRQLKSRFLQKIAEVNDASKKTPYDAAIAAAVSAVSVGGDGQESKVDAANKKRALTNIEECEEQQGKRLRTTTTSSSASSSSTSSTSSRGMFSSPVSTTTTPSITPTGPAQ